MHAYIPPTLTLGLGTRQGWRLFRGLAKHFFRRKCFRETIAILDEFRTPMSMLVEFIRAYVHAPQNGVCLEVSQNPSFSSTIS